MTRNELEIKVKNDECATMEKKKEKEKWRKKEELIHFKRRKICGHCVPKVWILRTYK